MADFAFSLRNDVVVERAARHAAWVVAAYALFVGSFGALGGDAHAYYTAWVHHLYGAPPESRDAYLYSPAFAQAIWPLTLLPWSAFCALWFSLVVAAYAWLLAPLPYRWRIPLLLICLGLDSGANVWAFFAVTIVVGFRRSGLWAFPLLTKVTPFLGPVWFAARREWRSLAISLAIPGGIVAVSFAAAPHLWSEWLQFLRSTSMGPLRPPLTIPTRILLPVELPAAGALTVFAARKDRAWLVPVAMVFANPVLTSGGFLVLSAIPRLLPRKPLARTGPQSLINTGHDLRIRRPQLIRAAGDVLPGE